MQNHFINEKPLGYQQMTGLTATTPVSPSPPPGTKLMIVSSESQSVRWRDDGVAPTASVGYPLGAGNELRYTGTAAGLKAIQFVAQTSGATLNFNYYAQGEF